MTRSLLLPCIFAIAFLVQLGSEVVLANNGSVAIGTPVQNIQVDGDFGDWPANAKRYALTRNHFGDAPLSDADFQGWFHVGYDSGARKLFVAMEVQDDSIVTSESTGNESWKLRDSAGICIAIAHGPLGQPVDQAIAINYEDGTSSDSLNRCVRQTGNVGRFEWCIDLTDKVSDFDFERPFTVAFDAEVSDSDKDGSFSIIYWSPMPWKQQHADRGGDLLLGVIPQDMGSVSGRVSNGTSRTPFGRVLVRYASITNANLVIDVMSDAQGRFNLELPKDTYERTTPDWPDRLHRELVEIAAGDNVTDDIVVSRSRERVAMGHGKSKRIREPSQQRVRNRLDRTTFDVRRYTSVNGIPNSVNHDLVVDDESNIWIANDSGLVKLSGNSSTKYTTSDGLPDNQIHCLYKPDQKDILWIGTDRGVARFDYPNNTVKVIPELQGKSVFEIKPLHNGDLGFATSRGLFISSNGICKACPGEHFCLSICADPSGAFTWIGTQDGVCKYDGEKFFEFFDRTNGLPDNRIWEIFADSRGDIWFGANRSIFAYHNKEFVKIRSSDSELYRHCDAILEDRDHRVWCQTHWKNGEKGVVAYDKADPNSLTHELPRKAHAVRSDQADNIWLMLNGSVAQMSTHRTRIGVGDCRQLVIEPAAEPRQPSTLWFSVKKNDHWFLRSSLTSDPTSLIVNAKAPGEITSIVPHGTKLNHVWVGTVANGLLLFDGEQFGYPENSSDWPKTSRIFCLRYHSSGDLWIATSDGITVARNDAVRDIYSMATGLPTDRCDHLDECSSGQIVCGTYNGVIFLDHQTGTVVKRLGPDDGLPDNFSPLVTAGSDGSVWIGTFKGLYRYKAGENDLVTPVADARGILNSSILKILEVDAPSNLMVISELGVVKMSPNTQVAQVYCRPTSVGPDELFSDIAIGDGSTWIATSNGIRRCSEGNVRPTVVLNSVSTEKKTYGPNETIYTDTDLPWTKFEFQKFNRTSQEGDLVFRYRLINEETKQPWQTALDNVIQLKTPPQGSYQLQVMAYDRDLAHSPPFVIDYRVGLPYRRWIQSLLPLAFLSAGVGFALLYIVNVVRTNRVLELRVAERTAAVISAQEEQQRLQLELMHAQKMESLGTMAAGMAHDFNNTLCAIACNAELGLMRLSMQPDRVEKSLHEVISATEQASSLTKSLLTFAGKSNSRRQPKNLQQIVTDAMNMIRGTIPASIQIKTEFDTEPIWCDVDEAQLKQVVVNLSVNARDAMPNGGLLCFEVSTEDSTANGKAVREAVLRVTDNGSGMKAAESLRIFEPFYTTKPRGKGTGLGLSMAHSIISAHDGHIVVESKIGKGTMFEIRLPTSQALLFANSTMPMGENELGKYQLTGTIIVADDEARVRETLLQVFESVGVAAIGACDGEELVSMALENQDNLALVVADIDMPRLDGISALQRLREVDPDLPAIIITGKPNEIKLEAMVGPTTLLRKPFALRELLEQTHRYARPTNVSIGESV